jgi:hypothetical protein
MLAVASSPGLKPMESPLATLIRPQSRTYRRGDFGGAGFFVCEKAKGAVKRNTSATAADTTLFIRFVMAGEYHQPACLKMDFGYDERSYFRFVLLGVIHDRFSGKS